MQLSLESILQRLVRHGNQIARNTAINTDNKNTPTSIRLKPETKHFLDIQAEALNTSTHSLISMILDGVAETNTDATTGILRTIRERFFYVFQSHGLTLLDVVDLMKGYGFSLSSLENNNQVLNLLTRDAIRYVANMFFCSQKWLMGASDDQRDFTYDVNWYKKTYEIATKLISYHRDGFDPEVFFIRRENADFVNAKESKDDGSNNEPIGIFIRLSRAKADGTRFYVYQTGELQRWNYRRYREQLKLLICFCEQANSVVTYSGHELSKKDIDAVFYGRCLPNDVLRQAGQKTWFPRRYVGISGDVLEEADEWADVAAAYTASGLQKILEEYRNKPFQPNFAQ